MANKGSFKLFLVNWIKYFLTTLLGTGADCLALWLFSSYVFPQNHFGQYVLSPMLSFECAVIVNYFTAYFYVWKDRITDRCVKSFFSHFYKYNVSYLSAFALKMIILNILGATLKWDPVVCNLIALAASGTLNFVINEFVIFRKAGEPDTSEQK